MAMGTVSVRLKVTGSSGATAIDAAQCTPSGESAQPSRPSSSEPRSQAATAAPAGGAGTTTVCRMSTGRANPDASYWVTARSVMPNWTPEDPSSVPTAVMRTQGVSPYGSATVSGVPGVSKLRVEVPLAVEIWIRRTWAPTAVALGVSVSAALVTGRSKSICSHWPIAGCSELDTQAVAESLSTAATGPLDGETLGKVVASADELEALSRAPDHWACTAAAPGDG